jgi:TetR/AcrR family transcriptional repressor of bet genes
MPRPSNRQQRRAEILQAFMRVVARQGYARATMSQVAADAGLAAGLIHYHFESKQELLVELFRYIRAVIRRRLLRRTHAPGEAPAELDALIDAHLALDDDSDRLAVACWQVLGTEALFEPALGREYRKAVRAQVRELEAVLRLQLPPHEARPAAAGILATIQGYFSLAAVTPEAVPRGTAASTARRMARGLLALPRDGEQRDRRRRTPARPRPAQPKRSSRNGSPRM